MIEINYKLPQCIINCPYCKARNIFTEIKYRTEYEAECQDCGKSFYVRFTLKLKSKVRRTKAGRKTAKTERQLLSGECDDLWSRLVKAKAGFKCELTGRTGGLNSHHIIGRSNKALKFDERNGICLHSGQHKFLAHNENRRREWLEALAKVRGAGYYEWLENLGKMPRKPDLKAVKLYLENELKCYE